MNFFGSFSEIFRRGALQCSKIGHLRSGLVKEEVRKFHSMQYPLLFQSTPILYGEPLKKKRRIDPAVARVKVERKVRRLMREIRRHEKVARKFKPIAELEVPKKIIRESARKRPPVTLSKEEMFKRMDLQKEWSMYKKDQHIDEANMMCRIQNAQERALDALQEASPALYEQAIQIDPTFIPFTMTGPVETPPLKSYVYPDGEYIDITKKFVAIVSSTKEKKKGFKKRS